MAYVNQECKHLFEKKLLTLRSRAAKVGNMNKQIRKRVDFWATAEHRQALENLAKKRDLPMSQVIWQYIERAAKKEGCWPE